MTFIRMDSRTQSKFATFKNTTNTKFQTFNLFPALKTRLKYWLLFSIFIFTNTVNAKAYIISLPEPFEKDASKDFVTAFFNSAYEGLNLELKYVYLPYNRATQLFNEGKVDAIGSRILAQESSLKGAYRVEKPFAQLDFVQVCLTRANCDTKLKRKIGTLKNLESIKKLCNAKKLMCETDHSIKSLVKALEKGLIDSIILTSNSTAQHLCRFEKSQIYYKKIEDFHLEIYHYISNKNQYLAPHLAKEFQSERLQNQVDFIKSIWLSFSDSCGKHLIKI